MPLTLHEQILRGVLFVELILAVILFASVSRRLWFWPRPHRLNGPIRTILVGSFGFLLYGCAGQAKAYDLGTPFDAVSWLGLVSVTIINLGALAWLIRETEHGRR